jgi:cobalt-precorrin-5B (C1)-methyltransferase
MRTGYTTGSNAAAAAKAATIALLSKQWPEQVTITLPIGETATMTPVQLALSAENAFCCMVKDAGDDPDVTHGALICACVRRVAAPGIHLEGGEGVGRVTLRGLGLEIGGPAINPVPRQQITANVTDAVQEALVEGADFLKQHGLEVIISVPNGSLLARQTLNPRLGIINGISILGTTGKVFPYSTESWRACVVQAVQVAASNGSDTVVLATGGRSEHAAQRLFPTLPDVAFVEMSTFTVDALRTCILCGVRAAVLVGMVAKLVKTAQGHLETPVALNQVDFHFLVNVCRETGAPADLVSAVAAANTARHFLELCQEWEYLFPVQRIVDLALQTCERFVQTEGGTLDLGVVMVGFDGAILGRAGRVWL